MFKGDLQKHFVFDDYLSSDAIDFVKAVLGVEIFVVYVTRLDCLRKLNLLVDKSRAIQLVATML